MCGIVGIISKNSKKISKNIFLANTQMKNRGPDGEGYVLFNEKQTDICYGPDTNLKDFQDKQKYYPVDDIRKTFDNTYNIAFGHRRLSIVDLSSHGHQPICDKNENFWIVFNGEVYNFQEIKKELISLGWDFVSDTDTEVILKSYIQWKERCLDKFNGMFAFAIYDKKNHEIFLARDRVGIKPLYYTMVDDTFIFASDIKTIIKSKLYAPEVDWEGLYHNFSFSITPRPNTSFKNIFALKQAHYMKLNTKTLESNIKEYWDIPTNVQEQNMTENEAAELLEYELKKSIKYRLIADVEVGTFMSGGIDSTTISAIASKLHPNIKAFTLAFDKSISKYDEVKEAKATAKMHNMKHIISIINADDILENIDSMVLGYEEPFYSLAPNLVLSKIVKDNNVKVVLNGLGGDELFAGYSMYSKYYFWNKVSSCHGLLRLIPYNISKKINILKDIANIKNIYQYYANSYSTFNDREKEKIFGFSYDSINEIEKKYKKQGKSFTDDLELLSYLDIKSYIGNHHVHRSDQFAMHYSIEGRFPFLDHNLIEKAFTIPAKYKLNGTTHKYILRKIAQKYIAPECLSMKKKGFGLPLEFWFENQLKDLVKNSIDSLKQRDFLVNSEVDNIMQHGKITQKWQLVMFELWYKRFIEKALVDV